MEFVKCLLKKLRDLDLKSSWTEFQILTPRKRMLNFRNWFLVLEDSMTSCWQVEYYIDAI